MNERKENKHQQMLDPGSIWTYRSYGCHQKKRRLVKFYCRDTAMNRGLERAITLEGARTVCVQLS